jgi:hypothetical protein
MINDAIHTKNGANTIATFLARLLTYFVIDIEIALKKRINTIPANISNNKYG